MRHKSLIGITSAILLVIPSANTATPLKMEQIPSVFKVLTADRTLANPAMVLIDTKSGKVIFSRDANGPRKPASTIKVFSAMSILEFLPPTTTFSTSIYKTDLKNTFQIVTPSSTLSKSDKFIWSTGLVNKIRANSKSRTITIRYYGITSRTKINMSNDFRRAGYRVNWQPISQEASNTHIKDSIYTAQSPNLEQILKHTLLWSDNFVAEYLARLAAKEAGYPNNEDGIELVFHDVLSRYNIHNPVITARDGSGLSHKDRVSAMTLGQALVKIYSDPKFESLVNGLPIGGVSGTMKSRFKKTAPQGVGLVRAKTGSLSGVVTMAGYLDSGDHEYAFVILADRVGRYHAAEVAARKTMDKLLGKITYPLVNNDLAPSDNSEQ
jgi:D-alanyl-D-alanine carboxypeptidase